MEDAHVQNENAFTSPNSGWINNDFRTKMNTVLILRGYRWLS